MSAASVTHWISQLKAGDRDAARQLWDRYFQRLVSLAHKKLHGAPRRAADEEDVALAALDSFFRAARDGRFPRLEGRDSLWRLLAEITVHKALRLLRAERARKRGGGAVRGESVFRGAAEAGDEAAGFEQVLGQAPTPADAAQFAEDYERLLDRLADPELKSIAVWALEGYTNSQIAEKLGKVESTVERKLKRIRSKWSQEGVAPDPKEMSHGAQEKRQEGGAGPES